MNDYAKRLSEFLRHISKNLYVSFTEIFYRNDLFMKAFDETYKDVEYHFPNIKKVDVFNKIVSNNNELPIFLFRLGTMIADNTQDTSNLSILHGLMRTLCGCEIYFNNKIDVGFYIVHGLGTVVGSRNVIGKGFVIYQNCTIGHKNKYGKGNILGNNVKCYAGAKIIGENTIGDNVIIGANTVITKSIMSNVTVYGNPNRIKSNVI